MTSRRPGAKLIRALRAPARLYDWHVGWILGRRFLRLTHVGRRTGRPYRTMLEVIGEDRRSHEVIVVAGLGRSAQWYRNLLAGGAIEVAIGGERFTPSYRELDPREAVAVLADYEWRNRYLAPILRRVLSWLVGWRYAGTPANRLQLVSELPIVAFRPARNNRPGDRPRYDITNPKVCDPAHQHDDRLRAKGALMGSAATAVDSVGWRSTRSYGMVFNEVAVEYDQNRPAYPDALVDRACEVAHIGEGDRVLEIGSGTGQLTRSLLERGLRVTALEPGDHLIRVAEEKLKGAGDVELVHARFEDVQLPGERYAAVFSASAIHWVDPDLGWRKIAHVLAPGGTLALIQYFGLRERRSVDDQEALLSVLRRHAAEIAATLPIYRDLDSTIAGVRERRRNVADAWGWLGSYDVGRDYAADLFEDLQLATVPTLVEQTADELNALLATMSFWARLSPAQRDAIVNENHALHERLGRPIRASTLAVLLTARRGAPTRSSRQHA